MSKREIIALIPARGGSKRLPGKNIKLLSGKPLIAYSIEAALSCTLLDAVYVSTDCPEIARVSHRSGALLPPLRPAALASDTASSTAVVKHFLKWYCQEKKHLPDTLVLLQPTSPLRTGRHITEAVGLYQERPKPCSVVSVTSTKPIDWQGVISDDQPDPELLFYPASDIFERKPAYLLNGAIYCSSPERYSTEKLFKPPVYPYVMAPEESVDIDSSADFHLAEFYLNQTQANPKISVII